MLYSSVFNIVSLIFVRHISCNQKSRANFDIQSVVDKGNFIYVAVDIVTLRCTSIFLSSTKRSHIYTPSMPQYTPTQCWRREEFRLRLSRAR